MNGQRESWAQSQAIRYHLNSLFGMKTDGWKHVRHSFRLLR